MDQVTRGIVFKGNAEGLIIVFPEECDFEQAKVEIGDKVKSAARFFNGAKMKVLYRGITLTDEEEQELREILDQKSGAIIEGIAKDTDLDPGLGTKNSPRPQGQAPSPMSIPKRNFLANMDELPCKFVKSTVRSGTRITFDGSVVVVGDINPGGEIVASGNIVVLGSLRGMVHAGAAGMRDAFVYALRLKPTQIRIAEAIARTPDGEDVDKAQPEIARIIDGAIVVEQIL